MSVEDFKRRDTVANLRESIITVATALCVALALTAAPFGVALGSESDRPATTNTVKDCKKELKKINKQIDDELNELGDLRAEIGLIESEEAITPGAERDIKSLKKREKRSEKKLKRLNRKRDALDC